MAGRAFAELEQGMGVTVPVLRQRAFVAIALLVDDTEIAGTVLDQAGGIALTTGFRMVY